MIGKPAFLVALSGDRQKAQVISKTAISYKEALDRFHKQVASKEAPVPGLNILEVWQATGARKSHRFPVSLVEPTPDKTDLGPSDREIFESLTMAELRELPGVDVLELSSSLNKGDLIDALLEANIEAPADVQDLGGTELKGLALSHGVAFPSEASDEDIRALLLAAGVERAIYGDQAPTDGEDPDSDPDPEDGGDSEDEDDPEDAADPDQDDDGSDEEG